jgi:ferredoxin
VVNPVIRIHVDQDKCIGAGHCVRASARAFDQREEDGIVVALLDEAPDALEPELRKAERLCPSQAICIETTD